ncbi:Platinum sensitivity protein [Tulasnella sp. 403]|nr:Platinum sensitivity protein [Tulasnella sp. 403]
MGTEVTHVIAAESGLNGFANAVIPTITNMKLLTQEEAQAHQYVVVKGGAKGFALALATSLSASYLLHKRWAYYRSLPPSLKALGVVMVVAPWTVIEAERQSGFFELEQRRKRAGYVDPNLEEEAAEARRKLLSPKERALDWAARHRYSIVGGSWALSMAGAFGWIMRDPLQTTAQKVVQARIWAQGLTLGVLIASADRSQLFFSFFSTIPNSPFMSASPNSRHSSPTPGPPTPPDSNSHNDSDLAPDFTADPASPADHSQELAAQTASVSGSLSPARSSATPNQLGQTHNPGSPSATSPAADSPDGVVSEVVNGVNSSAYHPQDARTQGEGSSTTSTTETAIDSSQSDADGECFSDEWLADMRRVKVYKLVDQRWFDRGTALCTGIYDEELDSAAIVARSELTDVELLRSEIRVNDVYQRQQETLIVWTEPDGTDYALSFQDVEGCAEIYDFIMEVQRHFRGKLGDGGASSSSPSRDFRGVTATSIISSGGLPAPRLEIISEIDKAIKFIGRTPAGKEKICEYIVQKDYVKGLIEVMSRAEDLEALSDLHALCSLMQTILMMNDHTIYDYILQDDIYTGVIGMLEYDPEFPSYKAAFREYLANSTQYKEVVIFRDESIRKKIQQTYRLQYLKDVVLARVLDDPTFNVLNSCILFNQIDIISHIQNDDALLKDLFGRFEKPEGEHPPTSDLKSVEGKGKEKQVNGHHEPSSTGATTSETSKPPLLSDPSAADSSKRDVITLLHQLCMMGKNVQIPARLALYRTLVEKGLLHALQWALSRPADDQQMLNAAGEILLIVCDHDVCGVRGFVLKQADPNGDWDRPSPGRVMNIGPTAGGLGFFGMGGMMGMGGIDGLNTGVPPGVGIQEMREMGLGMGMGLPMGDKKSHITTLLTIIIRVLTTSKDLALRGQMAESLKTLLEMPSIEEPPHASKGFARLREDPTTERFLQYFYDSCIVALYRPLTEIPEFRDVTAPIFDLSRDQSSLILYLCDNLCNFVYQHSHRSQFFLLSTHISKRIATLLKAREKHLRLAALRFFRVCIKMNNNFLLRHLAKNDLFAPLLELTLKEARRDNLINASCQEFFEYIRKENIRFIINHIMEKYEPRVRELCKFGSIGDRFRGMVIRWEQNNEPPAKDAPPEKIHGRIPRLGRPGQGLLTAALMESEEEEEYFNASDEEEMPMSPSASPPISAIPQPNAPVTMGVKRKRLTRGFLNGNTRSRIPTASGTPGIVLPSPYPMKLVDYDDAEDDKEGIMSPIASPASSPGSRDVTPPEEEVDGPSKLALAGVVNSGGNASGGLTRTKSSSNLQVNGSRPKTPEQGAGKRLILNGTSAGSSGSPPRLSEKRRREDDDDEILGLLASGGGKGAKRGPGASVGGKTDGAREAGETLEGTANATTPSKAQNVAPHVGGATPSVTPGGGIAKKIKLSFGKAGLGIASHIPAVPTKKEGESGQAG